MINPLVNILLSGLLWRRYKFFLVSLIITVIFMVLVGQVHKDYLSYNALLEEPGSVGLSFAIKWAVWLVSITLFLLLNQWHNKNKQTEEESIANTKNSALQKFLNKTRFKKTPVEEIAKDKKGETEISVSDSHDAFANLRKKDKLRSYAEVIIDKKKQ